jgi:hypothetical protein
MRACLSLLVCLLSCSPSVTGLYDRARVDALANAAHLADDWGPEAVVHIQGQLLTALVQNLLEEALAEDKVGYETRLPMGMTAELTPRFRVQQLVLAPSTRCRTCFSTTAMLQGTVHWSIGPVGGNIPATIQMEGDFWVKSKGNENGFALTLVMAELSHLEARVGQFRGITPSAETVAWAKRRLVDAAKPISMGEVGGSHLPIADLRVLPSQGGGVRIELATTAGVRGPITSDSPALSGDWVAGISTETLLSLARRAAFEHGEIQLGIYADPRGLTVEGENFTLLLRLWRVGRRAWWRDYRVEGTLSVSPHRIRFLPERVEELDHSRRARVVDPLVMLAQARLLEAVAQGCMQALATPKNARIGAQVVQLTITTVQGADGVLWLAGNASAKRQTEAAQEKPAEATVGAPPQ